MATDRTSSKPLIPAASGYWSQSREPLVSLVFITPFLVVYEAGVLLFGAESVRNGVDTWLRSILELMGFGQYFLLPLLTVGILLGWHHTTHGPWRISGSTLWGMVAESLLLAICLRLIWAIQSALVYGIVTTTGQLGDQTAVSLDISTVGEKLVTYLGAGIYEELFFRLILLSATVWVIRGMGASVRASTAAAVLLTSLVFAAAHYVGPYGEALAWSSFVFRFLAGVFFSLLFLLRGFGIAAGSHAVYDILVGLP